VLSLSQALSEELRKKNVTVTPLSRRDTHEFDVRAGMSNSKLFNGPRWTPRASPSPGTVRWCAENAWSSQDCGIDVVLGARLAPKVFSSVSRRKLNRV